MWEGGEVWILGGGSSVPEMFGVPPEIMANVQNGRKDLSQYSPFLSAIHQRNVLGVNMAYMLGDWLSGMYFGDRAFFKRNKLELLAFKKLKITHANLHFADIKWHYDIKWLKPKVKGFGISSDPEVVIWNRNSGSAAINVAALAGAKRILLLGFDMLPNSVGRTHWHGSYGHYRIQPSSFVRFLKGFNQIAEDAKRRKIEILNVTEASAITVFPKVTLKEVL